MSTDLFPAIVPKANEELAYLRVSLPQTPESKMQSTPATQGKVAQAVWKSTQPPIGEGVPLLGRLLLSGMTQTW